MLDEDDFMFEDEEDDEDDVIEIDFDYDQVYENVIMYFFEWNCYLLLCMSSIISYNF